MFSFVRCLRRFGPNACWPYFRSNRGLVRGAQGLARNGVGGDADTLRTPRRTTMPRSQTRATHDHHAERTRVSDKLRDCSRSFCVSRSLAGHVSIMVWGRSGSSQHLQISPLVSSSYHGQAFQFDVVRARYAGCFWNGAATQRHHTERAHVSEKLRDC